jgi:N4-(beta-N-acetylglucosaminyl)-L-asparaginase
MKRRSFFRLGALGGIGLAIGGTESLAQASKTPLKPFPTKGKAIVLSTWSHGIAANEGAWKVLQNKGKSLDAVMEGVMVSENDITNRSVGIGGRPDRDGHVTLDACLMDERSRCGAVAFLEGYKHPVKIAREVMEQTQHVMLVGEGAEEFAAQNGHQKMKTPLPEVQKDYEQWRKENEDKFKKPVINHENHDTIGMIALDAQGNLSGACTTSGWAYKLHGRVGDSPIIGAGLFVDNEIGAAVATGLGEAIIRIAGSHTVVECMRHGMSPQKACEEAVKRIIAKHEDMNGLQCGFIALSKSGEYGAYSTYEGFNFARHDGESNELINANFDRKW